MLEPMSDYPWKRFWCPRDGSFQPDRDGFLSDPEDEFGSITNPQAKPFESLTSAHFLGLVGEAGSGKTQTLKSEYSCAEGSIAKTGDLSRFISLRDIGSETALDRAIFEADWFKTWREGKLHLFLDALDEASDFFPQVASRLLDCLSHLPLRRLFVRVTCRTASWPRIFDTELCASLEKEGLGAEPYAVHELLPLRRKDVELAAASEGLDSTDFVEEVVRKGAVALASKPLSLRFLLASYKATKALPPSTVALYRDGCRDLTSYASDARRDARAIGSLDADQRLAIAERLAAVILLGNKQAIWLGLPSERPASDISFEDIRGIELFDGRRLEISDGEIREVVGTALFSSRGEDRFGWSHQAFGEFLAARYLERHELTTCQILSLVCTPNDSLHTVRPQLVGISAWLSSMREDVRQALLKSEPAVLLLSDSTTLNHEVRRRLITGLLEKFEDAELVDREGSLFRLYAKLEYPGMAQQVREAVTQADLSIVARREAIAMARACNLKELGAFFAEFALNGATPIQLRSSAAITVSDIGDSASRRSLLPLAAGLLDDPDDELKGASLAALWPGVVEVQEILPYLTRRKRPNHYGLYEHFLLGIPEVVSDQDIPPLLRWISGLGQSYSMSHSFGGLASRILDRAWAKADAPEVMAELPEALRNAKRLFFEKSKAEWSKPTERRRVLVNGLAQTFESREEVRQDWPWSLGIPDGSDFEWMLTRLGEDTEKRQPIWLELLGNIFRFGDARQADALLEAAQHSNCLAVEFEVYLGSVELNSARAEQARNAQQEREKWTKFREARRKDGKAELAKLLDLAELGELEAWSSVPWALAIGPEGKAPEFSFTDLAAKPGWLAADPVTRVRIIDAADNFVKNFDPKTSEWLTSNSWPSSVIAGLAGFCLLVLERPETLSALPTKTWELWAPAIASYPFFEHANQTAAELRRAAYKNAPDAVLETIAGAIDADDSFATEHVDDFWDERVANLLVSKLQATGLKEETFSSSLRKLLDHGSQEARRVATSMVAGPLPTESTEHSKVVSAAIMLFARDAGATWPLIWPALETDAEFAQGFFVALARDGRPDHAKLFENLEEPQAADLYFRIAELFPHSKDRPVNGLVGPADEARMLRNSLLAWLQSRGTHAACDAIASIAERMPNLSWLKWVLLEANQARRRNAPNWPNPEDILKIAADKSRRLIRDAADLQEVVLEALAKLEMELQGETPAVRDLWDKKTESKFLYRPEPEDDISDYLKRYLDRALIERGVVVNREVRVHRGERTDIHVDAVIDSGTPDVVTVIIEVKGCWNPELLTAMKKQLVDQYLTDNRCRHGIYLVFWFDCESWDREDPRWKRRPWVASMDELQSVLAGEAAELSGFSVRPLVLDARLKR